MLKKSKVIVSSSAFADLPSLLATMGFSKRIAVLTDHNLNSLYGQTWKRQFETHHLSCQWLTVPPGEASKSLRTAERLYKAFLTASLDRTTPLIALGGGVIGDLGGFVAASFMRGMPLLHIPTTLLAMVDSAIGGKVAVNLPFGKNLIGFFYEPEATVIDPSFLNTLPRRDVYSGMAEVVKYGLIADKAYWKTLEKDIEAVLRGETEKIHPMIFHAATLKRKIVNRDVEEKNGIRATLNFGHTFAHAIEHEGHYRLLRHGEAVLLGMTAATYLSAEVNGLSDQEVKRIESLFHCFSLPKSNLKKGFLDISPTSLYKAMEYDKKKVGKSLRFVLLNRIGNAMLSQVVYREAVIIAAIEKAQQFWNETI